MEPELDLGWKTEFEVSGENESREARLYAAYMFMLGRLGLTDQELQSRVDVMEDHEGALTVRWRIVPSHAEREACFDAWTAIGELRQNVSVQAASGPHDKD